MLWDKIWKIARKVCRARAVTVDAVVRLAAGVQLVVMVCADA